MFTVLDDENSLENPDELSGQFEGDMILNEEQWKAMNGYNVKIGLTHPRYRWPNRRVPYDLSDIFGNNILIKYQKKNIFN